MKKTTMKIGDRVTVIDQEITGTILRPDCGNKWVILDDNPDQDLEEGDEPTLTFREDEIMTMG
jgi:hypothetical protein